MSFTNTARGIDFWNRSGHLVGHARINNGKIIVEASWPAPQTLGVLALTASPLVADPVTLHERFGHAEGKRLDGLRVAGLAHTGDPLKVIKVPPCNTCLLGKAAKPRVPQVSDNAASCVDGNHPTLKVGKKLLSDLFGPVSVRSLAQATGLYGSLDQTSGHVWVSGISKKTDAKDKTRSLIALVERQSGNLVKVFCSDKGGEYINGELTPFFLQKGIVHETSAAYAHEQMGDMERFWRALLNSVRTVLIHSGLPLFLWEFLWE